MVDLRSQSIDEPREATPNPGGGQAGVAGDLARVEAGDVSQCQQPAVVWLQVGQGALEIDQTDGVGSIAAGVLLERIGDVDHRTPSLRSDHLASLIGGDGDQPRAYLVGVAQRSQSTPGDRPRGLDRVAGRFRVPADDERHAGHGRTVLRDKPRESYLVTLSGEADRVRPNRCVLHGDTRHVR